MSDSQALIQRAMQYVAIGYRIIWSNAGIIQLTRPRPALSLIPTVLFGVLGPMASGFLLLLYQPLGILAGSVTTWFMTLSILMWFSEKEQSLLIYFDEAGEPREIRS